MTITFFPFKLIPAETSAAVILDPVHEGEKREREKGEKKGERKREREKGREKKGERKEEREMGEREMGEKKMGERKMGERTGEKEKKKERGSVLPEEPIGFWFFVFCGVFAFLENEKIQQRGTKKKDKKRVRIKRKVRRRIIKQIKGYCFQFFLFFLFLSVVSFLFLNKPLATKK